VDASTLVISPDGKNVYVAGAGAGGTLEAFSRAADGSLSPLPGSAGCLEEGGGKGSCTEVRGVSIPTFVDLAISPDGKTVYWGGDEEIVVLQRDPSTGALTQPTGSAGCVNHSGSEECLKARGGVGAFGAQWIKVSPDGATLYAGSTSTNSVLTEFKRDAETGALSTPAGTSGCVSNDGEDGSGGKCAVGEVLHASSGIAISPDGNFAYVASPYDKTVEAFKRTASGLSPTGAPTCLVDAEAAETYPKCTVIRGMLSPGEPVLSPDGTSLYIPTGVHASLGGVTAFSRSATTGALAQLPGTEGCITESGSDEEAENPAACTQARGVAGTSQVAASADGGEIYAAGESSSDLAVLHRAAGGALTQSTGAAGCHGPASNTLGCTVDRGMAGLDALAVSPDDDNVYGATEAGAAAFGREQPPPPASVTGAPTLAVTKSELVSGALLVSVEVVANGLDTNVSAGGVVRAPGMCGTESAPGIGAPLQTIPGSSSGVQHLLFTIPEGGWAGYEGSLQLSASNSAGSASKTVGVAFPAAPATGAYADVSGTTVTFHDVDAAYSVPSGGTHTLNFRYQTGFTSSDALAATWTTSAYCPAPISKTVSGLQPGTTYQWRTVDDVTTSHWGEECRTWVNYVTLRNEVECWPQRYTEHDETFGQTLSFTTGLAEASSSGTFTGTTITVPGIVCLAKKTVCTGKLTVTVPGLSCTTLALGCHPVPKVAKLASKQTSTRSSTPKRTVVLATGSFSIKKHKGSAKLRISSAGRRYLKKLRSLEARLVIAMKGKGGKPITTAAPLHLRRR